MRATGFSAPSAPTRMRYMSVGLQGSAVRAAVVSRVAGRGDSPAQRGKPLLYESFNIRKRFRPMTFCISTGVQADSG
jgi:hypothetical protein